MKSIEGAKSKGKTRRVLSLKERIEVIRMSETNQDSADLAARFNCGRTQILTILQQKEALLKEFEDNGDPNRVRRRPSTLALAVNRVVAEWIHRCQAAQISVSDDMIAQKAYQAQKFFKHKEFRANKRWLERFKKRFRFLGVNLETVNPDLYDGVKKSLKLSDIYHDIKFSLDSTIVETMNARQDTLEYKQFLVNEDKACEDSFVTEMAKNEMICSFNEQSDGDVDDEMWWQMENYCETESEEEKSESIKDDQEALGLIKRLEEYSMLKDNYRAVGLLVQLEQIFTGQLES